MLCPHCRMMTTEACVDCLFSSWLPVKITQADLTRTDTDIDLSPPATRPYSSSNADPIPHAIVHLPSSGAFPRSRRRGATALISRVIRAIAARPQRRHRRLTIVVGRASVTDKDGPLFDGVLTVEPARVDGVFVIDALADRVAFDDLDAHGGTDWGERKGPALE